MRVIFRWEETRVPFRFRRQRETFRFGYPYYSEDIVIESIEDVILSTDYGEAFSELGLPDEIGLTLNTEITVNVAVTWDEETYNRWGSGVKEIHGSYTPPEYVTGETPALIAYVTSNLTVDNNVITVDNNHITIDNNV